MGYKRKTDSMIRDTMSSNRDSHRRRERSVIKPSRLPLFQKTMPQRHAMVCPGKKQIRRMIHRGHHAYNLTTYKVLVGGAVFLLIMVAVALSQASCDYRTHIHRALFPWSKKDAF